MRAYATTVLESVLQNDRVFQPAVLEDDLWLIQDFHIELEKYMFETCNVCQERWLHMDIRDNRCARWRRRDTSKRVDESDLMSMEYCLDSEEFPIDLPFLTQVEEMLITRVHVHVEICQVRGQQYKYMGNIVNFLRDTGKVYNKLVSRPGILYRYT